MWSMKDVSSQDAEAHPLLTPIGSTHQKSAVVWFGVSIFLGDRAIRRGTADLPDWEILHPIGDSSEFIYFGSDSFPDETEFLRGRIVRRSLASGMISVECRSFILRKYETRPGI